jgi:5'-nucleotidase
MTYHADLIPMTKAAVEDLLGDATRNRLAFARNAMPYNLNDLLVIGITSRALFDLDEADAVFKHEGIEAYREHQRLRETVILASGTGFSLVENLLRINDQVHEPVVEVVVISRNDADSGIRILNSIEAHGLGITRAAFTDGRPPWPYLKAFDCDLFLSAEREDVEQALRNNRPAALVLKTGSRSKGSGLDSEVRIAFDGDAVLFDHESEHVYQTRGLEAFNRREAELAEVPLSPGPFKPFLDSLAKIQRKFPAEKSIRLALVTSRAAPAHRRVVNTLRQWGIRLNETFFLGGVDKSGVLAAFKPHIFFDDQLTHLETAQANTPSAHVVPVTAQPVLPFDEVGPAPKGPAPKPAEPAPKPADEVA